MKLNDESAAALNALFTPAVQFTDGQLVGTAEVHTKIVGRAIAGRVGCRTAR